MTVWLLLKTSIKFNLPDTPSILEGYFFGGVEKW
jgi:hypothetical protein